MASPVAEDVPLRLTIESSNEEPIEETYTISFSASALFKEKLERMATLMGYEYVEDHIERVLEKALDSFLDRKDPKRKKDAEKKVAEKPQLKIISALPVKRYVPAKARRESLNDANYQCEFVGFEVSSTQSTQS